MRIVSLLPSATEIVCALGAGDELVGRSAECDFPAEVRRLPVVMRARTLDSEQASRAIDERVQQSRLAGESLYELDVPLLRRLQPDVLLTQDLCGVCSVTGAEVSAACAAAGVAPRVVSLTPRTLQEVWGTVAQVGEAIGRQREATRLMASLARRTDGPPSRRACRLAVVEWLDPPILAGLWTPAMIRAAGADPLGPRSGDVGIRTTWAEIERLRPELTVLSPCSFTVDRTLTELNGERLAREVAPLGHLGAVWIADEAYFSRPGPRLADGVELLRALVGGRLGEFPMPVVPWRATEVAA